MANKINSFFASAVDLSHAMGGLAAGSSYQTALVDNTTLRYPKVYLAVYITLGASPAANRGVFLHLLRGDDGYDTGTGSRIISDNGSDGPGTITIKNARQAHALSTGPTPAGGDVLEDVFVMYDVGPWWGIAVANDSGDSLANTPGGIILRYTGEYPEIQDAA